MPALEPAVRHDVESLIAKVDEAAKILQRARTRLTRAKGRSQAAMLVGGAG